MKIKKSELKVLIERYLNEITPDIIDPSSGGGLSAARQSSNQMGIVDTVKELQWPQDYVMFEDAFEHHVKSWQTFSRLHPKSAFFIQMIDLSGVSSWGDMAKSIENVQDPGASTLDDVMYFLNMLSSTPIAFIMSLGSGRLIAWIANKILPLAQGGNMSAKLTKIANSTDEFAELFQNVTEIRLFKGAIDKITRELVRLGAITPTTATKIVSKADDFLLGCKEFLSGLDTLAFRVFAKFAVIVAEKISEGFAQAVMKFYVAKPDIASDHAKAAMDLANFMYDNSPETLQDAIDAGIDKGENFYDTLVNTFGLD